MFISYRIYFLIGFILILAGCSQNREIPINKEPKSKLIKVNTQPSKAKKIVRKRSIYKFCSKHIKIMNHASNYILEEFEKGYFFQKDVIGAKAQLFLVENKSPTLFAQNINVAKDSYDKEYQLAKKYKCSLKGFETTPLKKIKVRIEELETNKVSQ